MRIERNIAPVSVRIGSIDKERVPGQSACEGFTGEGEGFLGHNAPRLVTL